MADTQLDKLAQAWRNLRARVNTTLPDQTDRIRAIRLKLQKQDPPGPGK
jgi:hypothetical protein